MEVKEYFEQLPEGRRHIRSLRNTIRMSRKMLPSISGKPYDLEWTTGSKSLESPQERELRHIMELEEELQIFEKKFETLLVEADTLLSQVGDYKIQSAMRHHYIYGESKERVAHLYNRDERTLRRWFCDGFKQIILPVAPISLN